MDNRHTAVVHPPELPTYELGLEGEQRDRLVGLVRSGVKTMTSSLLVHLQMDDEELPLPGQRFALVDSEGRHGALEIVEVRLLRLGDVGQEVVVGEGEGFRNVTHWRQVHEDFWSRWSDEVAQYLRRERWTPTDEDVVVVEIFRRVPPAALPRPESPVTGASPAA